MTNTPSYAHPYNITYNTRIIEKEAELLAVTSTTTTTTVTRSLPPSTYTPPPINAPLTSTLSDILPETHYLKNGIGNRGNGIEQQQVTVYAEEIDINTITDKLTDEYTVTEAIHDKTSTTLHGEYKNNPIEITLNKNTIDEWDVLNITFTVKVETTHYIY